MHISVKIPKMMQMYPLNEVFYHCDTLKLEPRKAFFMKLVKYDSHLSNPFSTIHYYAVFKR